MLSGSVLIKVILIVINMSVEKIACNHNFFIANEYDTKTVFCVTNSSSAISWIINDTTSMTNLMTKESTFLPNSQTFWSANCTQIEKEEKKCLTTVANEIILDRRWEKLEIHKTFDNTGHNSPQKFKTLAQNLSSDSSISFSVRVEKEAHIYMCEENEVSTSNCYWFILLGFDGKKSLIRECPAETIPIKNTVLIKEPCNSAKVNETSAFITNKAWNHFQLIISEKRIALLYANGKEVMGYTDTDGIYNVKFMIIRSKQNVGLWKLHTIKSFHIREPKTETFQTPLNHINGVVCISMYVRLCLKCMITLGLRHQNNNQKVVGKIAFTPRNSHWKEIRFHNTDIKGPVHLIVITSIIPGDSESNPFWELDDIKQCSTDGFRMLQLTNETANCQLLSSGKVLSLDQSTTKISFSNTQFNSCSETSVSHFCTPCFSFLNKDLCGNLKICESFRNSQVCSCAAGYQMEEGNNCNSQCNEGRYGFNCKKNCSMNCVNCHPATGTCDRCKNGYLKPKCISKPLFEKSPEISVSYSNARIKLSKMHLPNDVILPISYAVQYKEAKKTDTEWISLTQVDSAQKSDIEIQKLQAGVTYDVKFTIKSNEVNMDTPFHQLNFSTKCDVVVADNFVVHTTNISADVTVDKKNEFKICSYDPNQFKVEIKPSTSNFSFIKERYTFRINGLEPFTHYEMVVKTIKQEKTFFTKKFQTAEGIPDVISNLSMLQVSSSKVSFQWVPGKIKGALKSYIIKYKINYQLGCQDKNMYDTLNYKYETKYTSKSSITLTDLIPYSYYTVSVAGKNTKFEGPFKNIEINTSHTDTILKDEIPNLVSLTTDSFSLNLKLSSMNCTQVRGPHSINIFSKCLDVWCKNSKLSWKAMNQGYRLEHLQPYTTYSIYIEVCRNLFCVSIKNEKVQTEPQTPSSCAVLSVYSKNNTSISVRWQPPYPPTGILELYNLQWTNKNNISDKSEKNVTNSPCQLWSNNYLCFTINNLQKDQEYEITIVAKNQKPDMFGLLLTKSAITKIEPSEPPIDLNVFWSLENDLIIKWKHPNQSNGDIQNFNISVLPKDNEDQRHQIREKMFVTTERYLPIYTHIIKSKNLLPSEDYKITVRAYNGYDGSEAFTTDPSPPHIPSFDVNPIIIFSNKTVFIETSSIHNFENSHQYQVFVFVRDKVNNISHPDTIKNFERNFDLKLYEFKLIYQCDKYKNSTKFNIGKINNSSNSCNQVSKIEFIPNINYNITILLINNDGKKNSYKLYSYVQFTPNKTVNTSPNLSLLALLSVLLIIPIGIFIFIKRRPIAEKFASFKNEIFSCDMVQDDNIVEDEIALTASRIPSDKYSKIYSKVIQVSELEHYIQRSLKNKDLEQQHELFPRGLTQPCERGSLKENKSKNRYTNLVAYDHTRVVLRKIKGKPHSDYINANYIDGYKVPKAYIATQGPKISTTVDFWRMIWQENVRHIAMLANVYEGTKKKVEKYWPDKYESLPYGHITIHNTSNEVFTDFEHRVFRAVRENETREIHQYHFSSWPDHGVPLYSQSLVPFLEKINMIPLSSKSPIVVHCSAGVGRTGTILLCDICLRMAVDTNTVDMLRTLQQLRNQRPNMVDNIFQYKLAHLVILEYLYGMKTGVSCSDINKHVHKLLQSPDGLKAQMQYLIKSEWQVQAMKKLVTINREFVVVKEKNRFQTVVPDAESTIYISRYPLDDPYSTYINAVKVDGFQSPNRLIVTQQPMPNTLGDFWRLVHEKDVTIIISLNDVDLKNKNSCLFWPSKGDKDLKPVEYITLKHANTLSLNFHDLISIHMHVTGKEDYKTVEIMALKGWKSATNCPKNMEAFLTFCDESQVVSRQAKPVLITCFDGALASGLYAALTFIVEKMKLEQICDVCQAVRTIRHSRRQFVQNEEQFEFLYRAAVSYIDSFQLYANFN